MSTTEGTAGRRLALVVATGTYADPTLAKLRAPGRDAADLAAVLEDAAVGGFEVEMVLDAPAESLRRRIAQFCTSIGPGDLALVYLSCHGVLDDRGRLYYATADTDRGLLSATAVSSGWLNEQLEDCRSRRQILVLDCCHSGAFAKGAKGEGGLALRERFEGRGRIVLTGSRGTEYSFEHGHVVGDSASSVFTSALVEGLRSGDADRDGDGLVTISELYDYAYETVRTREARQTPTLWTYGAEGDLLVARSPRGAVVEPVPLPEDLAMLLESARPRVREGAVVELAELLTGPDAGRALSAREQLESVAAGDVPSVASKARAALEAAPGAPQKTRPPAPPAPPAAGAQEPPDPPPPHHLLPPGWRAARAIAAAALAVAVVATAVALLSGAGPPGPPFSVGDSPRGIGVGEGATWVARYNAMQVSRIDPSSEIEPIDVRPHPDQIAAGEGSVWVGVNEGRGLDRIDPATFEITEINVGEGRSIAEIALTRGLLWVSSTEANTIRSLNPRNGVERETYDVGEGFDGEFAVGGGAVWAVGTDNLDPSTSWLVRIELASTVIDRIPLPGRGSFYEGIAYGQGKVWLADAADGKNMVSSFDPSSEEIAERFEVKNGITGDDIAVTSSSVVVWDANLAWLTRFDPATGTREEERVSGFQKRRKVNREGSELALDGDFAWLTDPAGGRVYKVKY
jgi:streptogramin lyase